MDQVSRLIDGVGTADLTLRTEATSTPETLWSYSMPTTADWAVRVEVTGREDGGSGYAHFHLETRFYRDAGDPTLGSPLVLRWDTSGAQSAAFDVDTAESAAIFTVDDDGLVMNWTARVQVREVRDR